MITLPCKISHKSIKLTVLIAGLCYVSTAATAQNLHMNDLKLKSELDWLQAQGVIHISTSTWPLTKNEISRALSLADIKTPEQQQIVLSLRHIINENLDAQLNTSIRAYAQSNRKALPQSFADDNMANAQATAVAEMSKNNWEFNLHVNVKDNDIIDNEKINFDGTYVAASFANQWLIAGQTPTWWGPGNDGSLIRGDATDSVIGLTMQRDSQTSPQSDYLNWIGPWQYQLFIGQLQDYQAIPHTKLIGTRLTSSPTSWLELGASRTIMWGGEGRTQNLTTFVEALTGVNDNTGNPDTDPTNSLAGFDTRITLDPLINIPVGVYAQYIGEDEAGGLPAKNMYLAGLDYASSFSTSTSHSIPYQLYTEYTDTRSSGEVRGISYNHYIYSDGYYEYGYPLGYALGGDAQSIAVGGKLWLNDKNFMYSKAQYAKVNQSNSSTNRAFPISDKLKVIDVTWEHQLTPKIELSSRIWGVDSEVGASDIGTGFEFKYSNF